MPGSSLDRNQVRESRVGAEPRLPFEIVRRILHWRLALGPSYPGTLRAEDPITPGWDSLAGQSGRQAAIKRRKERVDSQDAALDLMRVCKAWKVSSYPHTKPYHRLSYGMCGQSEEDHILKYRSSQW